MVKEFCDRDLTILVTVDDAVSTPAVIWHNQKILNLCLQLLRALPNFVWPETVPNSFKLKWLRNQTYMEFKPKYFFFFLPRMSLIQDRLLCVCIKISLTCI